MKSVLLLFVSGLLFAQPRVATNVRIFPQDRMVGRLNEIVVQVCSAGTEPLKVQSIQVWSAVQTLKFDPATHVKIEEESASLRGMSGRRKVLLVLSMFGFAFTIGDQAGAFKIGDEERDLQSWKVVIPIVAGMIPVTMIFVEQKIPESGLPQKDRMLPAAGFTLDPGACTDYVMYGKWR